ncbi:hypothetical protein [Moraxella lacunata]|uniref:hypothetical protein n=1 Tax=Moraxella lacunata TaxID=477 RepID=UPI003EE09112
MRIVAKIRPTSFSSQIRYHHDPIHPNRPNVGRTLYRSHRPFCRRIYRFGQF